MLHQEWRGFHSENIEHRISNVLLTEQNTPNGLIRALSKNNIKSELAPSSGFTTTFRFSHINVEEMVLDFANEVFIFVFEKFDFL